MRTLFLSGRLAQAIHEMNNYYLAIIGIAEDRWTGAGKQKVNTGETIICSCRQDNDQQKGVALIIASEDANALLLWKPISERLQYARLNASHVKLTLLWPSPAQKTQMKRTWMISTTHCR